MQIYLHTSERDRSSSTDRSSADPNLDLCDVVEDLYGTDPTKETLPTEDHAGYTAPTVKRHYYSIDHTDQG